MRGRGATSLVLGAMLLACQNGAAVGDGCGRTGDCTPPLVCRFERCRTGCTTNRDCPGGSRCFVGASGAGACSLAVDDGCASGGHGCPSGLVCAGNECVTACATSTDCPSDGQCLRAQGLPGIGFCYAPPRDDAGNPLDANVDAAFVIDDAAIVVDATMASDTTTMDAPLVSDAAIDASGDASCSANGVSCTSWTDCCSAICNPASMTCEAHSPCTDAGMSCSSPGDCCSGSCVMGVCQPQLPTCGGHACGAASQLCLTDTAVCAVRTSDHHVLCWGTNLNGVLGDGTASITPRTHLSAFIGDYSTPVEVIDDASLMPLVATRVACMQGTVCALRMDGTPVCWGVNGSMQTGQPGSPLVARATAVPGVPTSTDLSAAVGEACALPAAGPLWCWGLDSTGATGHAPVGGGSPPTMAVWSNVTLGMGTGFVCGRHADGTVSCAGSDAVGVLGPSATLGSGVNMVPVAVPLGMASSIVAGAGFACALVSGTPWCWGDGSHGSLGRAVRPSASCECSAMPAPVSSSSTFTSLWTGARGTMVCATTASSDVYCWGLAHGAECWLPGGACDVPVRVPALYGATSVVDGVNATCAILGDGTVACFGSNQYFQLGDTALGRSALTPVCIDPGCMPHACMMFGQSCMTPADCCSGLTCSGGSCTSCGGAGQACCAGSMCTAGGTTCSGGMCRACGAAGQPCCSGSMCSGGACCNTTNLCVASGTTCGGGLTCGAGTCACTPGVTCATNAMCNGAGTACVCNTSFAMCAGGCVDLTTDASNCGMCAHACGAGLTCNASTCGCVGAANGTPCGTNQVCMSGACVCSGSTTLCGGSCVDTTSDPMHCGGCPNACGANMTCVTSSCTCGAPFTNCAGACVDTNTDSLHCGSCTSPCTGGQSCSAGLCCVTGQTNCGGTCFDLQTSCVHCGSCADTGCAGGTFCVAGCHTGQTNCGGTCANLSSDPMHCGTCTNVCGGGQSCTNGGCCTTGLTYCTGTCRDTQNDASNCGMCGRICGVATPRCVAGTCST